MNPTRAGADWPPAVIAGAYRTGILGMRSLARRGVRVACFDSDRSYAPARSVYGPVHVCPDPDVDPRGWVAFMIDLARKMGNRPVLICSADRFVAAVANHLAALSEHFVVSAGARLQGLLASKETQYELAITHQLPLPRTRFVHGSEDVVAFAGEAQFPCVLKPLHFREWERFPSDHELSHRKVAIAGTAERLMHYWRLASAVNPNVIVQEIIQGPDTAKRVYLSCYGRRGERIGNAMTRELRCMPVGFGPPTVTESIADPETDAMCDRFLQAIGFSGICEMEMKRDSRDGRMKLIEANPRLSGGGDAAPYAGVDMCWLHYLDLTGQRVTPAAPNGKDFRHVVLRADLAAIVAYRKENLISWKDIVRSYRRPLAFYDMDRHDWRYSAATIYRAARAAVGAVLRDSGIDHSIKHVIS